MKELAYWESRKARESYSMYKNVEKSAEELAAIYAEASADVEEQVRRLFRRFGKKYGISEKKAEELLVQAGTTDLNVVVQALARTSETAEIANDLRRNVLAVNRLAAVQQNVDKVCGSIITAAGPMFAGVLKRSAETAFYQELYLMQQYADAAFFFNPLSEETINAIVNTEWSGKNYSKRIWDNTEALATEVKKEIVKGFLTGESTFDMSETIRGRFAAGSMESRRLMRTEANYVANQASLLSYIEAGVTEYIYVAILDLKTSQICRSLDKKRFLVKNATVGENYPPMHPWCRSTTIAWIPDALLREVKQSAIDPATGERIVVPLSWDYAKWYKEIVEKGKRNEVQSNNAVR